MLLVTDIIFHLAVLTYLHWPEKATTE